MSLEIIIEKRVREKFKGGKIRYKGNSYTFDDGYPRTMPVDKLVVHGTASNKNATMKGVIKWMLSFSKNSKRGKWYREGVSLFHYGICKDGTIYEIIDPHRWCYHSSSGVMGDGGSVGVELLNESPGNRAPYTVAQYEALVDLYDYLKSNYFPQISQIVGHGRMKQKYSNGWKNCPARN